MSTYMKKTDKYGKEYKINVHYNSVCGDAVLTCKAHKLEVIKNVNKRKGKICHHF